MIQGLECFLLTVRAVENLPFCANSPDPKPEADILGWDSEFWLKSFCKISSCSLLKGLVSVGRMMFLSWLLSEITLLARLSVIYWFWWFPISRFAMNLPAVFLDMSWFVAVITPGSSFPLSIIIVVVWIASSSKGRSFHYVSWVVRSHHYFLSTFFTSNLRECFSEIWKRFGSHYSSSYFIKVLVEPKKKFESSFLLNNSSIWTVSSGQFQLWISNISRCCQWRQRVLKYWVIESSP